MKFDMELNAKEFLSLFKLADKRALNGGKRGMDDSVDELIRISSEIAPIDKGILQKSHSKEVKVLPGKIEGKVEYSVQEDGFNYALWTHEGEYELGEESRNKSGTSGWSGKTYDVGNKYLERPMKGERDSFLKHIAEEIKKELGE